MKMGNLNGVVLTEKEVAKAALNLVTDESAYISMVNFVVDGGHCLRGAPLMCATPVQEAQSLN
ncbi:unnamed protein product [Linum tenue]|uniref:Uncharacterized protein n=1 Tax=Linum tenue TaxID=586396 RepID=A0AAV0IX55_9ROSI|nr:unnamed protein product [Linum tenue]